MFKNIRKDKDKSRAASDSDKQRTERTPYNIFRCGSVDNLISKCPKPPKYNEKRRKQVHFNERGNRALQKESDNGKDDNN